MFRDILALALLLSIQTIHGFAPNSRASTTIISSTNFRPANFVSAAAPSRAVVAPFTILRMAEGDEDSKISADGTFYDDEVDTAPVKDGISDSMKAKLMAEASTGLDSNAKQNNVILYVILGVSVLVVAGGAGIFY